MKRRTAFAVAACALAVPAARASDACDQPAHPPSSGSTVIAKVCSALDAVNAGNAQALRALMVDDFALTSVSGQYYEGSRDAMIARWTASPAPGTTSRSRLLRVHRSYQTPTFGLVAGVIEDRTTAGGQSTCDQHTFTDVWEVRNGQWLWVQSHESGARPAPCTP